MASVRYDFATRFYPGTPRPAVNELDLEIEDGELLWGVDYGEENFPQELGDEAAVSYTKGCYLGQEVVARIHYRGGVQRRALGLRFTGELPALGTALLKDGREAGRVWLFSSGLPFEAPATDTTAAMGRARSGLRTTNSSRSTRPLE